MGRVAIELPKVGYDMEKGVVGAWFKTVGETVSRGEPIAEIETEKSMVDLESPATGILAEVLVESGVEIEVGTVLGYVDESG